MASNTDASTRGEEVEQSIAGMLASACKEAIQRHGCECAEKGTQMDNIAKDIGFWAYRIDAAFPLDMHNKLVTLAKNSFDPKAGLSEVLHR
ncbi:MAG: hypothetical protein ACKPKO_44015, partial [Candidatus Fonsibacter sp.]